MRGNPIKAPKNNAGRIARLGFSLLCAAAVPLTACGPSKTSGKGMNTLAAEAPPPPSGESRALDRNVSEEAAEEFAAAAAFYEQQDKAGWQDSSCRAASSRFLALADKYPKLIEARYNAGLALQNCKMNKEAEEQYQLALKLNPGHAPSLSNLGQIYFKGGNESVAKQYWEKAVQADGKIVAARNNLAWLMIRQIRGSGASDFKAQEEQVKGHLSRALAVDNDNVEAYVLYALLYMEGADKNKSRLTLAKLLLDKGEELDGRYAPLHNARGLLLLKQDNVPKALESFRTAVELDPSFAEARMNVGNIVLEFRKYAEAKAEFEAVLKLEPKNYDAIIGLGYAQRGLREIQAAEASYESAKKLDASRPEAHYNLGVLYKDFIANATEDLRAAQKAYRTSALHFKQAASKASAPEIVSDAKENIEDCEKNIKSLDEALKFQQQNKES